MASEAPAGEALPAAPSATPAVAPVPLTPPTDIVLRAPSRYASSSSASSSSAPSFVAPPLAWLLRTWSVTHSTLAMWRSAQNVRISYQALPDDPKTGRPRNADRVEYESNKPGKTGVKSVEGVNQIGTTTGGDDSKSPPDGTFDWRGKGWLFFVTSHWEVLGWGERPLAVGGGGGSGNGSGGAAGVERWAVTWFAPTLFTKEGIDIYSDRREGLSVATVEAIQKAASDAGWPAPLAALVAELKPVDIKLPWQEA